MDIFRSRSQRPEAVVLLSVLCSQEMQPISWDKSCLSVASFSCWSWTVRSMNHPVHDLPCPWIILSPNFSMNTIPSVNHSINKLSMNCPIFEPSHPHSWTVLSMNCLVHELSWSMNYPDQELCCPQTVPSMNYRKQKVHHRLDTLLLCCVLSQWTVNWWSHLRVSYTGSLSKTWITQHVLMVIRPLRGGGGGGGLPPSSSSLSWGSGPVLWKSVCSSGVSRFVGFEVCKLEIARLKVRSGRVSLTSLRGFVKVSLWKVICLKCPDFCIFSTLTI